MEPVIRSLALKGFRSFSAERVEFDNPTFLVGRNGSGKSNLVDALAFLADAMASPLPSVLTRRSGISAVAHKTPHQEHGRGFGLAVELAGIGDDETIEGARYAFEVRPVGSFGYEVARERCQVTGPNGRPHYFDRLGQELTSSYPVLNRLEQGALEAEYLVLPTMGAFREIRGVVRTLLGIRTYSIDPAKVREVADLEEGYSLGHDGGNSASVLQRIFTYSEGDVARIEELLAPVLPHRIRVRPVRLGSKLSLEFTQTWGDQSITFDASSMSDGTLRTLGLLIAVFQKPAPSLVVIEEPEASIHPGALGVILDALQMAARSTQVVVTTHSPDLIDAKWIEPRHLRIVTWENGASRIAPLAESSKKAVQDHLMGAGELLRSNALDAAESPVDLEHQGDLFADVEHPAPR